MDNRLLLLLLGLSPLLGFLQALLCHKCDHVNVDGSCTTLRFFCKAKVKQECILKKYYEGTKLLFVYQDCRYMCTPKTLLQGARRLNITCCNDKDFCNKFKGIFP